MSLLNKLEKKLNDLYSQKWFLLTVLVLAIVFVIFGYFLDRGFKIKESSTKLAPTVVVEQKKNCLPTNQDVEGPYFRPNAPMRTSIAPQDAKGERLVMSGILYSSDCKTPITKFPTDAPLIEVWQADSEENMIIHRLIIGIGVLFLLIAKGTINLKQFAQETILTVVVIVLPIFILRLQFLVIIH